MSPATGGERATFRRPHRLRTRAEFDRAYRQGFRVSGSLLLVVVAPRPSGVARLGLAASRRVGNAPTRNRIKRCIRESFRRAPEVRRLPVDLVVSVRPNCGQATAAELRDELERAWRKVVARLQR